MSLPAKRLWKPLLQKAVTGEWRRFRMTQDLPPYPKGLKNVGLYLHIPFCKNLCPYCPYNRVEYQERDYELFLEGVLQEVELYTPSLKDVEFNSLYIGGGTPTVDIDGINVIFKQLQARLKLDCDICVELHPASMDDNCLSELLSSNVSMISVGVESTSDHLLSLIGRSHDGQTALDAVRRATHAGFDAVNVDLMFALPGQTVNDWAIDLERMFDEDIDQLSTYPMFSFPYSELGRQQGINEVTRPNSRQIRTMLKMTDEAAQRKGFKRCAVWSWIKPHKRKFSSITRHHYIGLGPSAASMTGEYFYVNTFDIDAYSRSLPDERPIALSMKINRRLEMAYWLYWRVYELFVCNNEFETLFSRKDGLNNVFGKLLKSFCLLGMLKRDGANYQVTNLGAYWIHRLQNEYSLNYINRLWGTCRKKPWPNEVRL